MSYKPADYTSVAPYLVVADAAASLSFAGTVFGAQTLRVFRRDDGSIVHAEMRIDDTVVMLGQMPGGPPAHVHVYLPDPEAAFARALDAGGEAVEPVEAKSDGNIRGGVRDANGVTWWLSRGSADHG
jgi:uncharacterized glyoxalase superfamily protein PhnB